MFLIQKLKSLEQNIVFMRWATGEAYGKLQYVGNDYIEFKVIDSEHKYSETLLIRPSLILEIVVGGSEIGKVIAEVSNNIPTQEIS